MNEKLEQKAVKVMGKQPCIVCGEKSQFVGKTTIQGYTVIIATCKVHKNDPISLQTAIIKLIQDATHDGQEDNH